MLKAEDRAEVCEFMYWLGCFEKTWYSFDEGYRTRFISQRRCKFTYSLQNFLPKKLLDLQHVPEGQRQHLQNKSEKGQPTYR